MFSIFWRSIWDRKWTLISYSCVGVLLAILYASLNPAVQSSQAATADLVKHLPEALNKAFGLDPRTFNTFEGFVGGKQFSLIWPVLLTSLLAGISANFIAGEVEKGTIELALAQPISRLRIAFSKILAGVCMNFIYVVFSVLSFILAGVVFNISFSAEAFFVMALVGFLLGLAIFGIGMFFSSIFSEKGKVLFATVGVFILLYVVWLMAILSDKLDKLKYFTLFYYYDYTAILLDHKLPGGAAPVFLGIFLATSFTAIYWFNRRDIAT